MAQNCRRLSFGNGRYVKKSLIRSPVTTIIMDFIKFPKLPERAKNAASI